jgi:hypothetical protein
MPEQSIISDDMTLKRMFQEFYRVPDYQREYVWGEPGAKDDRGDEVEQFVKDIHAEFEQATKDFAPEYFIGTLVVCPATDGVFELIDGQQRSTTAFLTLCAIRDLLTEWNESLPDDLPSQIDASSTDWQGQTVHRLRLDLQYEDAGGVLRDYAAGKGRQAPREGTRSIANIGGAYDTIREILTTNFDNDRPGLRRFYGYLTNKVKLIRIQTPSVNKALKIFETINDRGIGLDAMDLLKNLLFMSAKAESFSKLKDVWKALTDEVYHSGEKPLRFLRYYLMATFDVDAKLREDDIYDWFLRNEKQTENKSDPLGFASRLLEAAQAYRRFSEGKSVTGTAEAGIVNTRALGGSAIRQHFILLIAGRRLPAESFTKLAFEIEGLMFVWLVTNTPTKDYERIILDGAKQLREITTADKFDDFAKSFFSAHKEALSVAFNDALRRAHSYDMRAFRLRYLLAKLTQHVDLDAYGASGARTDLSHYMAGGNDIEHILPDSPSAEAFDEFGEVSIDQELIQRLGNLMLVEKSVNRSFKNKPYSVKITVYPSSQFLLARCQAAHQTVGVNDQITRAMKKLPTYPKWNRKAVDDRQNHLAMLAHEVWGVPQPSSRSVASA